MDSMRRTLCATISEADQICDTPVDSDPHGFPSVSTTGASSSTLHSKSSDLQDYNHQTEGKGRTIKENSSMFPISLDFSTSLPIRLTNIITIYY